MQTPAYMEKRIERQLEKIRALEKALNEKNVRTGEEIRRLTKKISVLELEKDKAEQRERCADHEARKWKALYDASATTLKSLGHEAPQFGGKRHERD